MAVASNPPAPSRFNPGEWVSKYWPLIAGLAALLYSGIVRDDRSQRAAADFYIFAVQQTKTNQDQASTNAKLTTLIEGQGERLKRLEDRQR